MASFFSCDGIFAQGFPYPSRVVASFFSLMKRNKNPAYRQAGKADEYLSFRLNKSSSTILSGVKGFA
jgi:hypothetical protein